MLSFLGLGGKPERQVMIRSMLYLASSVLHFHNGRLLCTWGGDYFFLTRYGPPLKLYTTSALKLCSTQTELHLCSTRTEYMLVSDLDKI